MGILANSLIKSIINPTLQHIGLYSPEAVQLMAGTCAQESAMGSYLQQIGGNALGIYQMEPSTHDDLWKNYLPRNVALAEAIISTSFYISFNSGLICDFSTEVAPSIGLVGNLIYATCMCRVYYSRIVEPLPKFGDISGQARYWKKYYNTESGGGDVSAYLLNYNKYVRAYYAQN